MKKISLEPLTKVSTYTESVLYGIIDEMLSHGEAECVRLDEGKEQVYIGYKIGKHYFVIAFPHFMEIYNYDDVKAIN